MQQPAVQQTVVQQTDQQTTEAQDVEGNTLLLLILWVDSILCSFIWLMLCHHIYSALTDLENCTYLRFWDLFPSHVIYINSIILYGSQINCSTNTEMR